jgi:hypothetical protein
MGYELPEVPQKETDQPLVSSYDRYSLNIFKRVMLKIFYIFFRQRF